MPQVIITEGAVIGLKRCRGFLSGKSPDATKRAGQTIERQFEQLEANPNIGRPLNDMPELRELIIQFGDSGYVALYRYTPNIDKVFILAFRHQKEAGYQSYP